MDNVDARKLDLESKNMVNENIERIRELFPNVVVESDDGISIDFNLLKLELSKDIVDEEKEKYQLTWVGKKEAILNATYNYSNLGYFKLDNFDDNNVALIFKLKNYGSQIDVEMIIGNLYNEINEQQMRLDLESRMGKIRDLIYEKAFAPVRKSR